MLKMLKKLQNFDETSSEEEEDIGDEEIFAKLATVDMDRLSVQELECLLGPKHMERFQKMMNEGIPQEWIQNGSLPVIEPWYLRYRPSIVIDEPVPEFVPPIKTSTTQASLPVEEHWNDLIELLIIYVFLYTQFDAEDFKDFVILSDEIIPAVLGMSAVLNSLELDRCTYQTIYDAIQAAKASVFMNSPIEIEFREELLPGCLAVLCHPLQVQRMLSDFISWFKERRHPDETMAALNLTNLLSSVQSEETDMVSRLCALSTKILNETM